MNAFFLLYALTITLELVLSLVMAVFLFLILAPRGRQAAEAGPPPPALPVADTLDGAIGVAFLTISQGRNDLIAITNARAMLARFAREQGRVSGFEDQRA